MSILKSSRRLDVWVLAALAVWAAEARVLAYIDPGSGALIWQAIVAGFVGAGFYFRRYFGRFFSRNRRQDPPADNG
jgi:hypothetical protein